VRGLAGVVRVLSGTGMARKADWAAAVLEETAFKHVCTVVKSNKNTFLSEQHHP